MRHKGYEDFNIFHTMLKRVILGVMQHGGSYYKMLDQEREDGNEETLSQSKNIRGSTQLIWH